MKIEITRGEASFEGGCQSCAARSASTVRAGDPVIEHVNIIRISATTPGLRGTVSLVSLRLCDDCLPSFGADVVLEVRDYRRQLNNPKGDSRGTQK